jgi:hypothetical protein
MDDIDQLVTPSIMAQRIGALPRQVQRLCDRGRIPHRRHLDRRLIHLRDTETARQACIEAGYTLTQPVAAPTA